MDPSERRLAARLAAGEPEAFEAVYDLHGRDLYGYLLARTRRTHLAEDLLQVVMLRLVRSRDRLRKVENLRAYLFAIARNEWLRRGARREPENEMLEDAIAPVSDRGGDVDALHAAVDRLTPERREVVGLKIHHGLTFAQIGEVLAVSPDTAASRYRRALADLRRLLETTDVDIRS